MNKIPITHIQSRNCGGYGAWMENPLSSVAPGSETWAGFQGGGSRCMSRKYRNFNKFHKSRKFNKSNKSNKYRNNTRKNKKKLKTYHRKGKL